MEEQLKELLESVPNSYDDFVEGIMLYCDTDELRESMINFIDGNEGVSTSSVLDFYFDELASMKE
ncbi:MAG: hypothetical protein LUD53_00915 [Clostridiales bacterium]|nr:hypothetical protein [Clostridiales bacterium]